ncbi:Uncharacterised protein [Mycobacteroides abscessus subsp. abscessus]|nr:Uncharacterised protein [Mycobacteroides abscessus subsp. abscessus]
MWKTGKSRGSGASRATNAPCSDRPPTCQAASKSTEVLDIPEFCGLLSPVTTGAESAPVRSCSQADRSAARPSRSRSLTVNCRRCAGSASPAIVNLLRLCFIARAGRPRGPARRRIE